MTENTPAGATNVPDDSLDTGGAQENKVEAIQFDNLDVIVYRQTVDELYIALQPPNALPYIVAPANKTADEIVVFVKQWLELIRELRVEMLKRFEKSKSLKCHYQTGDVAFLFGRPFMLRTYPLTPKSGKKKASRGLANLQATIRHEISVIDLYLHQPGSYDQGRMAFLSLAKPIFSQNVSSLVRQCMERVFPEARIPTKIKIRPLRGAWIQIDKAKDTVWISENLIPYPPECVVYVYLQEMIGILEPEADEEARSNLLAKGLPNWQELKTLLADTNSKYSHQ